jgi:hypothetical protein
VGIVQDIETEMMPRMLEALRGNNIDRVSSIWAGWEKWLQGEFLLQLDGVQFSVSQETNIYADNKKSADFVFWRQAPTSTLAKEPNVCVVEVKAMTVNESSSSFKRRVTKDINKLTCDMSQIPANPGYVRLMMSVMFTSKMEAFSKLALQEFENTALRACARKEENRPKDYRIATEFKFLCQSQGVFTVLFIWWTQRAS